MVGVVRCLTNTAAWQELLAHSAQFQRKDFRLAELVGTKPGRFQEFSLSHEDLLLDFSKNLLTTRTLELLQALAHQQGVPAAIEAMFAGEIINHSEQRPALHIALREPAGMARFAEVSQTLEYMEKLVTAVHSGSYPGYSGKPITDIVSLGVGGSDLGPALVVSALRQTTATQPRVHFVSNIDPAQLETVLAALHPETTLFIVASKSFTTLETMHNAQSARQWLLSHAADESAIATHFLAVTANTEAALAFGIHSAHVLPMWDWVGGRFSVWSAIGLPIAFELGMSNFRQLLAGAHAMDLHFRRAKLNQNMPVILALLAIWYRAFFAAHSSAVIPYSHALRLLPAYLQQLSMESLGKSVDSGNDPVSHHTGEPVWGVVGTDVQHSCFQLLHQGTNFIPVDFIVTANPASTLDTEAHQQLFANCLSQSLALMQGVTDTAAPWRYMAGNKPSNTLLLRELSPYNLGSLLALYEHKVYVQSVIWNINAFDQWGVELGKSLSQKLFAAVSGADTSSRLDDSSRNLIERAQSWKRQHP